MLNTGFPYEKLLNISIQHPITYHISSKKSISPIPNYYHKYEEYLKRLSIQTNINV
jgi:hypothetical protein